MLEKHCFLKKYRVLNGSRKCDYPQTSNMVYLCRQQVRKALVICLLHNVVLFLSIQSALVCCCYRLISATISVQNGKQRKTNAMARQSKGRLFTRGKQKRYYLQYYVGGKQFCVALRDGIGNPITDKRMASIAAEEVLAPIHAIGKAEQLKKVREAIEDIGAKATRLQAEQNERNRKAEAQQKNERATIADGWKLYMTCPKRLRSCKGRTESDVVYSTTAYEYRSLYKRFSTWIQLAHPNVKLLSQVTTNMANEFLESIRKEYASRTVNGNMKFLRAMYDGLIRSDMIFAENPFRDIETLPATYTSKRPLTREQVKTILAAANGEYKTLIALGYFTGLRRGDCCTLLWAEVDLERRIISRIPRKTAHTVQDPTQSMVKVGIPPYLYGLLADCRNSASGEYVLPCLAREYLTTQRAKMSKAITTLFRKCGIETSKEGSGKRALSVYGFHSLRYSYISHCAESGVPAAIIQRNAGHSNPAMTEHYTKVSDEAARRYAQMLSLPSDGEAQELDARQRLHALADTLPLAEVLRAIEILSHKIDDGQP